MMNASRPLCPLSLVDVQAYIRSKTDDQVVGIKGNPALTLLAEVWYHRHGCRHMAMVRRSGVLEVGQDKYELSDELHDIHLLFERMTQWNDKITKVQWTEHAARHWHKMQEMRKGSQ